MSDLMIVIFLFAMVVGGLGGLFGGLTRDD